MLWARRDLTSDCSKAPPIGPVLYRGLELLTYDEYITTSAGLI